MTDPKLKPCPVLFVGGAQHGKYLDVDPSARMVEVPVMLHESLSANGDPSIEVGREQYTRCEISSGLSYFVIGRRRTPALDVEALVGTRGSGFHDALEREISRRRTEHQRDWGAMAWSPTGQDIADTACYVLRTILEAAKGGES